MRFISRRTVLAVGGTLAAGLAPRKPRAEGPADLASKLVMTDPPADLPDAVFLDAEGGEHRIAAYRGRGLVINFWATWCAPCVAEMPALAALSKTLAPDDIDVLPLSSDRGGAPVVSRWLKDKGLTTLPVLLDPKGAMANAWRVRGLPTTVIVDRKGQECARLEGAAEWSTPSAVELIRKLVAA
ncbi:MAG: TlpA family protein disulfide reductase [Acetobacteraceae bacterium]